MMSTSSWVSSGAPSHESCGERLSPTPRPAQRTGIGLSAAKVSLDNVRDSVARRTEGWFDARCVSPARMGRRRRPTKLIDVDRRAVSGLWASPDDRNLCCVEVGVRLPSSVRLPCRNHSKVESQRESARFDLTALRVFLDEVQVAKFKWPERVETVESLPRNATGKVEKWKLRETVSMVTERLLNGLDVVGALGEQMSLTYCLAGQARMTSPLG